jgi:hypothetical protein
MDVQKQMKERETLKQARQHANRKCTETTIEDQTRREKVAQKRTEKRNMELPHQAESRREKDAQKRTEKKKYGIATSGRIPKSQKCPKQQAGVTKKIGSSSGVKYTSVQREEMEE